MKFTNLFCASLLTFFASSVYAEPAIIITGGGCGLLDGNGDFFSSTEAEFKKIVSSQNGKSGVSNVMYKCQLTGVPNSQGKAVHWSYDNSGLLTCNTLLGATEDWKITVDTEGKAVMTCKIH